MADEGDQQQQLLLRKVHELGDLDLAALLSLIAREHCIVGTEAGPALDALVEELRLVARHTFGLDVAVVDCSPYTTLDDLAAAILVHHHHHNHQHSHHRHPSKPQTPNPRSTPNTPFAAEPDSYSYFNQTTSHAAAAAGYVPPQPRQPSPLHSLSHRPATSTSPPPRTAGNASPGLRYNYGTENSRTKTPTQAQHPHQQQTPSPPRIANIIVAKNLDAAPKAVQIQCLELLRTRRLFTRTSVQTAPKQFLFVAVVGTDNSGGGISSGPNGVANRLTPHLNDFFYISHWYDPADGFAHLAEQEEEDIGAGADGHGVENVNAGALDGNDGDERADTPTSFESAESVIRRPSMPDTPKTSGIRALTPIPLKKQARNLTSRERDDPIDPRETGSNDGGDGDRTHDEPLFNESDIAALALAACEVAVDVDVLRYAMNVASFLRLHRAVSVSGAGTPGTTAGVTGSVSPTSTRHLEQLVRSLAALHGLGYAPPALVGLAARKIYLHRLRVIGALRAEGAEAAGEAPLEVHRERSMQWGSDRAAVEALLVDVGPTEVLDDVLSMVDAPL